MVRTPVASIMRYLWNSTVRTEIFKTGRNFLGGFPFGEKLQDFSLPRGQLRLKLLRMLMLFH